MWAKACSTPSYKLYLGKEEIKEHMVVSIKRVKCYFIENTQHTKAKTLFYS